MKNLILFLVACSSVLGASDASAQPDNSATGLYVEVLIYSGRTNPRFLIDDPKVAKELIDVVKGLPKNGTFAKDTVLPSILGYNGLSIENLSAEDIDVSTVLVHRSNVELRSKRAEGSTRGGKEFRIDAGSKLEKRILQIAIDRGILNSTEAEATAEAK